MLKMKINLVSIEKHLIFVGVINQQTHKTMARRTIKGAFIENTERACSVYLYELLNTKYFQYCIEYEEYDNECRIINKYSQPIDGLEKAYEEYRNTCSQCVDKTPNATRIMGDFE